MDRGAISGAAEVPNVSSGLVVRTSQVINSNLPDQNGSGDTSNGETPHYESAHDEEVIPAREDVEGATNGNTANSREAKDGVLASASHKRKRGLSEPHANITDGRASIVKRKRRASVAENYTAAENDEKQARTALLQTIPEGMRKYFAQRHRLFHRYDEGIQLDKEAWYSVTPEKIAAHIAQRFSHLKVVVDLYSCVGGNSIQFAKAGLRVIAVEIDQDKINMAKNNAAIYGVQDQIEFRRGDVFEVLSSLRDQFDKDWGIFLSPPWGGPNYVNQEVFDVSVFKEAVDKAMEASSNVAILAPRNISIQNVTETFDHCELEENYLGGKLKTKTLYFGALEGHGVTLDEIQEF